MHAGRLYNVLYNIMDILSSALVFHIKVLLYVYHSWQIPMILKSREIASSQICYFIQNWLCQRSNLSNFRSIHSKRQIKNLSQDNFTTWNA